MGPADGDAGRPSHSAVDEGDRMPMVGRYRVERIRKVGIAGDNIRGCVNNAADMQGSRRMIADRQSTEDDRSVFDLTVIAFELSRVLRLPFSSCYLF